MDGFQYQYKVVYVDFRGRVSVDGQEMTRERGERSTSFVKRILNNFGREGWELVSVHPQNPAEAGYFIFKKPGAAPVEEVKVDEEKARQDDQAEQGPTPDQTPVLNA